MSGGDELDNMLKKILLYTLVAILLYSLLALIVYGPDINRVEAPASIDRVLE